MKSMKLIANERTIAGKNFLILEDILMIYDYTILGLCCMNIVRMVRSCIIWDELVI